MARLPFHLKRLARARFGIRTQYNDEPQRDYSGPEGGIIDPQKQDKLGVLTELEDGRLRVIFPWSVLESTYDILELKRPNGWQPD